MVSQTETEKMGMLLSGHDGQTLDPSDWESFRRQAHQMLDDVLDYTRDIRKRPVWQPIPEAVRGRFRGAVPVGPSSLAEVHREFMNYILPFTAGNVHPGFMGWVQGGGTPVGMLAEMLAAGLNANVGGRDQVPLEVERQIVLWMQEIFGLPASASGLLVTGSSMANFVALVVARDRALGWEVRSQGMAGKPERLAAYASAAAHNCVGKAMDLCGAGSDALRLIPTDNRRRMDLTALQNAIQKDRETGFRPFLVVGTAGTVDTGAIDDLAGLAEFARREKLWFHVDGAYGALAMLAADLAPKLQGIECADSLAFDFHKWGQVPYDSGLVLVRDGELHQKAFAAGSAYLRREKRGLAAGSFWPCDYGPELSRGFRALKTWFTLKVYGTQAIGTAISRSCQLARYLESRILNTAELELLAPVELNVVCFRYRGEDSDELNARIVVELQESGSVAPSTTILDGRLAIRAAIVNHRTGESDIETLLLRTLEVGRKIAREARAAEGSSPQLSALEPSRQKVLQSELRQVSSELAGNPNWVEGHFRRAFLLADLGQLVAAGLEYINVLLREPVHREALNNLAGVLVTTGRRTAALTVYKQALLAYPNDPQVLVNFGHFLLEESERLIVHQRNEEALQFRRDARAHFEHVLQSQPDCERAHEGLYYLARDSGDEEASARHQRAAFGNRPIIPLRYCGERPPVRVLQLLSTTGGNVRLGAFLDNRIFQTFIVLPEFCDANTPLPMHELTINGIGDAEVSRAALDAAQTLLAHTAAPVINPPAAVAVTTRDNNASRLGGIAGVVTPKTVTLAREQLSEANAAATLNRHGFTFPLLLRAPGFHTGRHFIRAESPAELSTALAELPGREAIVMQYLDARGADGKTRKYRVMMIDGRLYPLHLAISSQWKIHYFTAEMADSPENRAEDAAFLENMPSVLGPAAMNALEGIQSVLGLDYGGIDFGRSAKGEILLFEANATMAVVAPEPDGRWDYRRAAVERIRAAVVKMLTERAKNLSHQRDATG